MRNKIYYYIHNAQSYRHFILMQYCGTITDFVVVVHYVVVVDAVEVSRRTFLYNGHRPPAIWRGYAPYASFSCVYYYGSGCIVVYYIVIGICYCYWLASSVLMDIIFTRSNRPCPFLQRYFMYFGYLCAHEYDVSALAKRQL